MALSGKEPACQCRRLEWHRFDPWARNIPWKRAWQPTPLFLPGESHVQRRLGGLRSIGSQSRTQLKQQLIHRHEEFGGLMTMVVSLHSCFHRKIVLPKYKFVQFMYLFTTIGKNLCNTSCINYFYYGAVSWCLNWTSRMVIRYTGERASFVAQ